MHSILYHDCPIVDLGNFHLEEANQDLRIGSRQYHLRPLGYLQNFDDHGPDALPLLVSFRSRLFAQREQRFGFSDIDDYIGTLESLYNSIHHLADLLRVLAVDILTFGLTNLLENHLLGGLGRNTAQYIHGLGHLHGVIELQAVVNLFRFFERYFQALILHLLDDTLHRKNLDHPGLRIKPRINIFIGFVILSRRRHHRIFQSRNDDLGIDILFLADLLDHLSDSVRHNLHLAGKTTGPITTLPEDSRSSNPRFRE